MMNVRNAFFLLALCCALAVPGVSRAGDLDSLIGKINVTAQADLGVFKADLGATFGVSGAKIDGLFRVMTDPADVYMTLRIGQLSGQPLERVAREYQAHRGQGWGVIAKNLGIKPGSAEFHALKQNRLSTRAGGATRSKPGKPKSKGKKG